MISSFNELTANRFGQNWTVQMLIQLSSHHSGSSPMFSYLNAFYDARRFLSVSSEARPVLAGFSLLLEFRRGPSYGSSPKTKQLSCFSN